jgi:hypothetical protein
VFAGVATTGASSADVTDEPFADSVVKRAAVDDTTVGQDG